MKTIDVIYIVAIFLLAVLSFLFSAADMTYSSVNRRRLEAKFSKGDKKAGRALDLANHYDKTIAVILFGNDFSNVLISSLGSLLGRDLLLGYVGEELANTIASLVLLFFLLIFCEITPKHIASSHSFSLSKAFLPFMKVISILFFPFVWPSSHFASWLAKPLIKKSGKENPLASDEELEAMVNTIEEEGIIDEEASELLHRSIDFKETSCYEVMTPRVKVFGYDTDEPFEIFLKKEGAFHHSRVIVYEGNFDHVLGYIPIKTLLRELVKGKKVNYKDFLLPIVDVPRTMMISSAMALMKKSKHHIAVVRDEYGGMEGIITLEDILEELVGEMWDEKDSPTNDIRKAERRNSYYVNGTMNIDDFYNEMGLDPDKLLPDDYTTVSGWIIDHLGRFAVVGDSFRVGNIYVKVTEVTPYTVKEAFVRVIKKGK